MAYKIKRTHSPSWRRCVKKVKRKDTRVNPYAVCTSSLGRKSFKK
jgi:hypothetical protein